MNTENVENEYWTFKLVHSLAVVNVCHHERCNVLAGTEETCFVSVTILEL